MGKQNVVHACNGILPNLRKEGNSDTCYNGMNLEDIRLSEISQIQKGKMIPLICAVKFIETESRMVVARGWGRKEWRLSVQ